MMSLTTCRENLTCILSFLFSVHTYLSLFLDSPFGLYPNLAIVLGIRRIEYDGLERRIYLFMCLMGSAVSMALLDDGLRVKIPCL